MSQRTTPRQSTLRTRAAILAAGLGVTTALGAGVAFAANSSGDDGATRTSAATAVDKQSSHAEKKNVSKAAEKAKEKPKKSPTWGKPVSKYELSASYGIGGGRWANKHSGQDFAVPIGTNVKAAHDGVVVKAGPNGAGDGPAYGNAIVVKHGTKNAKYSQYAHLSKVKVHVGQKVDKGESIALSGNTGNSSGPHLHFEIRTTPNYGSAVNPLTFLRSADVTV
ncbi:M23 family metallopeptidase [Streptomyces sp. NBC_01716]|uniref:M23 family metallopeptidase n=1 Tax=Streptomyces sp. NBC_01716 TaxID=2975917 RepID=UPI002E353515|nr:M23 family metallopeptidase [Streptomyces sp. NBC_01716]